MSVIARATERLRPWLWAAWWAMAAAGIGISLLPGHLAASVCQGVLASHLLPFALLSLTGVMAARPAQLIRVMTGMVAIAVAIEVAQIWIPGRAFEWLDLWADGVGMAVGWVVCAGVRAK